MTYIIVDLEGTCCDQGSIPRDSMEIIEIGAVALAGDGPGVAQEFATFVRPVRFPRLTPFCTRLTGITQSMVDDAQDFGCVHTDFKRWIWEFPDPIFCSWGDYDRRQLSQDCARHSVSYPFDHRHINIKKRFAKNNSLPKGCGLGQAIQMVGLEFEGAQHRGIDDARNMARLSEYIFGNKRIN